MTYEECAAIEKAEGFDRTAVEDAIAEAVNAAIGQQPAAFESRNPGVVAVERVHCFGDDRLDWQRVMTEVARKTGAAAVCVAHCDWQQDDDADEEAVLIAFDIPSLPEDYRDDHRNQIFPVDLEDLPSAEDFDNRDTAEAIVKARLDALASQARQATLARKDASEYTADASELAKLKSLDPQDREIVAAIMALDFDKAKELYAAAAEPAPAPGI